VKPQIKTVILAGALALGLAGHAIAGPLEDAGAAEKRGDQALAVKILRPLAERGDPQMQYGLAKLYASRSGESEDTADMLFWAEKAADQQFAPAQAMLGMMYLLGAGVPTDPARALVWITKAAEQGNAAGETALGQMYARGQGVDVDQAKAAFWLEKAAEQRFGPAELVLGFIYERGQGVAQNYVHAQMLLSLASEDEPADQAEWRDMANQERDAIAKRMTPAELAEAARLTEDWRKQYHSPPTPPL
jgi:TPR repeat protein